MTEIKCRYSIPYCYYYGKWSKERVYHDEFWWCDDNRRCHIGKYEKPPGSDKPHEYIDENGKRIATLGIINPTCIHCRREKGEFSTTVKRYSWENGTLTIGKRVLDESEVDYLEVDGRVLIGKPEETNNVHD